MTDAAHRKPAQAAMLAAASLVLGLLALQPFAEAAQTTRYVYVNDRLGTPGEQVVEEADDGQMTVHYRYKSNGRGPELTERFRLAADGTFNDYSVQGTSEMGAPIDEVFERHGEAAAWHSNSERGETAAGGAALYVPINGSTAPLSVAVAALMRRQDGRLPLLPSGVLKQRVLDEVDVERAGSPAEKRRVQLVVQTGLGLQPNFLWVTTGARPRLFAVGQLAGEILIEDGWQASRATLEAHQRGADAAMRADMARTLKHPLPGLTVIRNARVFDPVEAKVHEAADVYAMRGRITAIVPVGSPGQDVDNEIDAAGRMLLPGLFDLHQHVGAWDGALNLAAGVTTVRDMGNDNATLQRLLDDIQAGTALSPQIVPCGFVEGRSPFSATHGITISTLGEAREAVDWYAERGYPQLKVYNSFPKQILRETVAYAHSRGMRVSGHVPAFMRAEEVVEQGFDEIQHINQMLLNFLVTPSTDTRTTERFSLPAEKLADFDFDSEPVKDFIELLLRHHTVIDPTLATFDFIKQPDGEMSAPHAAIAGHLPPDVQRGLRTGGLPMADETTADRYRRSYAKMVEFTGRLYRAGVPLVAGTDWLGGLTLPGELALYVQAGLTPAQALQVDLVNGANYSRTSADRGSISIGKRADLLLVDGDPTRDIGDIRKVALVITQGHWLSPIELQREVGVEPFVDSTPEVRRLTKP